MRQYHTIYLDERVLEDASIEGDSGDDSESDDSGSNASEDEDN